MRVGDREGIRIGEKMEGKMGSGKREMRNEK
jgi:hypothetical protein